MYVLGVDCGATNLRVGIVEEKGNVIAFEKGPSPLKNQPEKFAQKIKETTDSLLKGAGLLERDISGIGLGVPGPIDFARGEILRSSNLGNEQPIGFKHQFELLFDSKIYFDRDTNMALRGEAWLGAAADSLDVVMLSLGTGVGGAVLMNGQLQRGSEGAAGEIGHMFIEVKDCDSVPRCGLGHRGCLESFIQSAHDLPEVSQYLGIALANIVDILNPEKIVIGGGMILQGDFLPEAVKIMKEKGVKPPVDEVIVQYTKLGDLSGVIGAAKMALG